MKTFQPYRRDISPSPSQQRSPHAHLNTVQKTQEPLKWSRQVVRQENQSQTPTDLDPTGKPANHSSLHQGNLLREPRKCRRSEKTDQACWCLEFDSPFDNLQARRQKRAVGMGLGQADRQIGLFVEVWPATQHRGALDGDRRRLLSSLCG